MEKKTEIIEAVMSQHFKIEDDMTYDNIKDALENCYDRAVRESLNTFSPEVYELFLKPPFELEHAKHGIACDKFAEIRNTFIEKADSTTPKD